MSARSRFFGSLFFVLLLVLSNGALAADAGLVGWWKFDEGSGAVAGDSSRSGNNGTLVGAEWAAGGWNQKGHCLEFLYADSESDLVDLGFMDVVGEGITITSWVNPYSFNRHDARVISKSSTGATGDGHWWMLGTNNGVNVRFRLKTNQNDTTLTLIDTAGILVTGEWQFITAPLGWCHGLHVCQHRRDGQRRQGRDRRSDGCQCTRGHWQPARNGRGWPARLGRSDR